MAREITQRDLEDLGDERFEQLVASLVLAEHEAAERPDAPDGGADALLPATDAQRAHVWQTKHYTSNINWKKCEESLDRAVASYDPATVTFVFPRNLTKPQRDKFQERLVSRHANVEVSHWGLQRIQELLARHPDVAARYFGEDRIDVLPGLLRAVAQGAKPLDSTLDIADRVFELDKFANVTDPSFEYDMSFGRADAAPKVWSDVPFMVITQIRDGRRFTVEARLRPEAGSEALAGFTDDEAGRQAREKAREAFAVGDSVELNEGVWVRVSPAPVAAMEAYEAVQAGGVVQMAATLSPGEPHEFEMLLELAGETVARRFTAWPLPPPEGAQLSYGAAGGGLALFLDFRLGEPPVVSLDFKLSFRPGGDAAATADAAKFVLDFYRAERVTCIAPDFLPAEGITIDEASKPAASDDDLGALQFSALVYDAVATIEEKIGPLTVPDQIARADFESVVAAASFIRDGGGTFNIQELALEVPFSDVDRVMRGIERGHAGQHPLKLPSSGVSSASGRPSSRRRRSGSSPLRRGARRGWCCSASASTMPRFRSASSNHLRTSPCSPRSSGRPVAVPWASFSCRVSRHRARAERGRSRGLNGVGANARQPSVDTRPPGA
jgi:hypothetical protein